MSITRHHADWLSLVEVSGPFLSMPVLMEVFPQGLDAHDPEHAASLRLAYDEWEASQAGERADPAIHRAWVRFVLGQTLEMPDEVIAEGQSLPPGLEARVPEHGETLRPDIAIVTPQGLPGAGTPRLLVQVLPPHQAPDRQVAGKLWKASPATRMMELLHATEVPLGLVTNGEQWMLVYAPRGETTGYASWYASLWLEESVTLQAFRSLLGVRRFFGVEDDETILALLRRSSQDQQEVTDRLGYQVRNAVEVLVQAIDRIDKDRNRSLLAGADEKQLYQAALTVMMRLVFLLSAEERGLILLGDSLYDQHYAVSTLRAQLRETADQHGEELLERRHDAWSRLLATFRAVHAGVRHERMSLPAYGGSLFDPDRFPFLEGCAATGRRALDGGGVPPSSANPGSAAGHSWRDHGARSQPLPIHNRTVLHLLEALQILQVRGPGGGPAEARRLSFRALDIEQIGHVYEGLLDHTALRAPSPVLGLAGTKDREPEIPLEKLEELRARGIDALVAFLQEETGRSASALRRALSGEGGRASRRGRRADAQASPGLFPAGGAPSDAEVHPRLLAACDNDAALYERVLPFAPLLREDTFGYPVVIAAGSVYVTQGSDRRTTGTHYTPRSLTEPIVRHTLDPLVYDGPAEGFSPEEGWRLRSAGEILNLKVCDIAMGSGAFLVQACRYLSERLVEAWERAESAHPGRVVVSPEGRLSTGSPEERPLPRDPEERLALARRIVADRCLYGVDKNPMAVEMAKLSLWLITLAKGKPFTFLDHHLKHGDSLVGCIWRPKQLGDRLLPLPAEIPEAAFRAKPGDDPAVARRLRERNSTGRLQLTLPAAALPPEDAEAYRKLADVPDTLEGMRQRARRYDALRRKPEATRRRDAADLWCAAWFWPLTPGEGPLAPTTDLYLGVLERGVDVEPAVAEKVAALRERIPFFHWALEFPDVFDQGGFDAVVSNPPFQGGKKITGALGTDYREYLVNHLADNAKGHADLCAYFYLRARQLLREGGIFGMLATNTIAQGDTREVGLDQIVDDGAAVIRAVPSRKWPGTANLEVAVVWVRRGAWSGARRLGLEETTVPAITSFLAPPGAVEGKPHRLAANAGKSFQGSIVLGMGFVMTPGEAEALIDKDPRNRDVLFPYLNGEDLNSRPDQSPSRWVINFRDWPLSRDGDGCWRTAGEKERREWLRAGVVPPDYPQPVAADYPECLAIAEARVKPERTRKSEDGEFALRYPLYLKWWIYADKRPALYATIAGMERVLAVCLVTQHLSFAWRQTGSVFAHKLAIIASSVPSALATLQSTFHSDWTRHYSSTLAAALNYSPSDCFETFPFPQDLEGLDAIGERYHAHRQSTMLSRHEGLTKTYNRFHDPDETAADIARLRELHVEMDHAVAAAYGWTDLELAHGFHETKQGLRFTIREAARREVLGRLLALNHARYADEVARGLHEKGARKQGRRGDGGAPPRSGGPGRRGEKVTVGQSGLFSPDGE